MRTTCSLILLSLEIFFLYSLWEHSVSSHKICQSGFILDMWAVRGAIPNCLQNLDYASFQFQHKATSLNTSVPKSTRKHWGDTSLSHLLTSKPGLHEEEVGLSKLQTEVFTEKKNLFNWISSQILVLPCKKFQSFHHPRFEALDHRDPAQRRNLVQWQTIHQPLQGTCEEEHSVTPSSKRIQ